MKPAFIDGISTDGIEINGDKYRVNWSYPTNIGQRKVFFEYKSIADAAAKVAELKNKPERTWYS